MQSTKTDTCEQRLGGTALGKRRTTTRERKTLYETMETAQEYFTRNRATG